MTSLGAQAQRMTVERMIVQARREKDQTMSLRMAKRPPRNIWLEVYVNKAGNAEWKYDNKSISAGQAETYLAIYNATLEYRT